MMGATFQWNKPVSQIISEATGGKATAKFMAASWHRLYDPFVPMDTGTLAHDSVEYLVEGETGIIHHKTPYARKMYYGKDLNFSKERHPLASAYWDQAAKQAGKAKQLAAEIQSFIKRGV